MTTPIAPRGTLGFAGAVLAGGVSAALFAVALNHADSFLFFIIYLASIPLFVSGLSGGPLTALVAAAVGLAGLFATAPSNYGVIYAFIDAVPAVALILLALRYRVGEDRKIYWYPEGLLLTAMALYPCILFAAIAMAASGHEGGLLALTTQFVNEATEPMKTQMPADAAVQVTAMMQKLAVFLPSLTGLSWIFVTLISVVIAQNTNERHGWNLRSGFTLKDLHIPSWLIYAVAVTGLAGTSAPAPYNYIGANLSIILGLPFFFNGLAVVHGWAATHKATIAILIAFYIFLSIIPLAVLLVALLGVIDQWANFRQRFIQKPNAT